MTETDVCPECGATVDREFRVPTVVRTCDEGCGFVHFLREGLSELVAQVPEEHRPDDWSDLSSDERVRIAIREGVVTLADLRG